MLSLGRSDSEQVLKEIASAGLFLQPIEGDELWYRYHTLFAQALQACARRRLGREVMQACLGRASLWYEQRGMLPAAVEAALQAKDFAHAATLIEALIGPQHWIALQEFQTVQRWLSQLPDSVLHSSPALCFFSATLLTFGSPSDRLAPSTFAQVETLLQRAEQGRQGGRKAPAPEVLLAFRALLALRQGAIKDAARLSRQALAHLSEEQPTWWGICLGIVAEEERWLGQLEAARNDLLTVLSLFDAARNQAGKLVTIILLAEVYTEQGALCQAAELYHTALAWAGKQGADRTKALIGLAHLAYEWNEMDRAAQLLQEATEHLTHFTDESLQVQTTLLQARISWASGQTGPALHKLQTLLAWLDSVQSPLLFREVQCLLLRFELAQANLAPVQRWISSCAKLTAEDLPCLHQEQEDLLLTRWLLARGEVQAALHLLDYWRASATAFGRERSTFEIELLTALAHHRLNQREQARQSLCEHLAQARAQSYLRLFLDEGEAMEMLLRSSLPRLREKPLLTYLQTILFAFDAERARRMNGRRGASSLLRETLSPQERQVLRLLACGLSRQEIARRLMISLNTVKTHLQRIYQKLHVTNRIEAIERARHLEMEEAR